MEHPVVQLVADTVGGCSVAGSRVRIGLETVVVLAWVLVAVLEEDRVHPNAVREGSSQEDSVLAAGIAVLWEDLAVVADNQAENPVARAELGSLAVVAVDSPAVAVAADNCRVAIVHQEDPGDSCKYPIASNRRYRHPLHWNRKSELALRLAPPSCEKSCAVRKTKFYALHHTQHEKINVPVLFV